MGFFIRPEGVQGQMRAGTGAGAWINTEAILDSAASRRSVDPAEDGKETAPYFFLDW